MIPTVFFICLIGIIGVIAAAVILELARPWPDRQARMEAAARRETLDARQRWYDAALDAAAKRDAEVDDDGIEK